jgi:hypothetical protein
MTASLCRALTCSICQQIFDSPVSFATTCHHTFCSTCIRGWLVHTPTCPECRAERSQSDLFPARALGAVALEFQGEARVAPAKEAPRRLAQPVFSQWSDDRIKAELEKLDFSPLGSREANVILYREYLLVFNAAVDAGAAPDLAELRRRAMSAARAKCNAPPPAQSLFTSEAPVIEPSPRRLSLARKRARLAEQRKWAGSRVSAGTFRAIWSDALDRPVYYNRVTGECTTTRPPASSAEEQHEDDVIVII